ncbi:carotenoid oxygenase family protein [Nocardioides humilatus]|uniref:Dioxygenase n=1 Tax=Nocardioides humilatus TaxID=2607660 RepID=A0A5B1LI87_9ACTN|nr:carotenoid oxygenase family protein [Nocardioides humilatus]KAA1419329.1 carotenoid oxygenase family protein [Nocardioides humilatus]
MSITQERITLGEEWGIHRPLLEERDVVDLQVDGTIPAELEGTLYRIGPGKLQVGTTLLDNIFDGDGMISRFSIRDGRVDFRNRYVRTQHFEHGQRSSKVKYRGVGAMRPGGPLANFLRLPANVANTNVILTGDELLALWEMGRPHRVDPDTLETLGEEDFEGRLKWIGAFSAHPKWDPQTQEMFNFGLDIFPYPQIRCYRRKRGGPLEQFASIPMLDLPWNHDVALTGKNLVFVLDPIMPTLPQIALSRGSYLDALDYRPNKPTRFVIVPRNGGRPRIVEHDALMHFHVTNAFDDGDDVVVDLVNFGPDAWDQLKVTIGDARNPHPYPPNRLTRYRISPTGQVTSEQLVDFTGEFPQYDWRLTAREHRFTYLTGFGESMSDGSITKVDSTTGRVWQHTMAGHAIGEPLFVPRSPDAAEDDGWLVALAHDRREQRSKLVVLDARDPERDALATAHLPFNVPLGFHGMYTRRPVAS